ncbi:hypothetical protein V6N13_084876 [Hibiscus sabdariffa]
MTCTASHDNKNTAKPKQREPKNTIRTDLEEKQEENDALAFHRIFLGLLLEEKQHRLYGFRWILKILLWYVCIPRHDQLELKAFTRRKLIMFLHLVLSWHMKASTMCEYSKQEFFTGLQALGIDSLEKFRERISVMRSELKEGRTTNAL